MIPVTKSFLPPFSEYQEVLSRVWNNRWLTNNGEILVSFEDHLKDFLGVKNLAAVINGTMALQLAIRALELKGEIITTPFSYVATTSSVVWEGCVPVFADIDPDTLNVDPAKVQEKISKNTVAVLVTHVYGNPCDVAGLESLSRRHKLPVIYDCAHGFGVKLNGRSLFSLGDISTASFHSTKLFHSIEGGAVISSEGEWIERVKWLRNLGHKGPEEFNGCGINGKLSEFHAAMGLVNLRYIKSIIEQRRLLSQYYDQKLAGLPLRRQRIHDHCDYNYAYYPVIFESEDPLLETVKRLGEQNIIPRRYFYPSLNTLPYVTRQPAPVSEDISHRVLCLPLYTDLEEKEIDRIANLIQESIL